MKTEDFKGRLGGGMSMGTSNNFISQGLKAEHSRKGLYGKLGAAKTMTAKEAIREVIKK